MSGEHLISDEETRRFAEGFLADSPGWVTTSGNAS